MFLDIIVIFPFRIPVFVPLVLYNGVWDTLSRLGDVKMNYPSRRGPPMISEVGVEASYG